MSKDISLIVQAKETIRKALDALGEILPVIEEKIPGRGPMEAMVCVETIKVSLAVIEAEAKEPIR